MATRAHPRWSLRAAVDLESDEGCFSGLSSDVSAGGIFVAMRATPPKGAPVTVKVILPDGRKLDLTGTVRWIREPVHADASKLPGCGIQWDDLPMDALRTLLHFADFNACAYRPSTHVPRPLFDR